MKVRDAMIQMVLMELVNVIEPETRQLAHSVEERVERPST